MVTCSACYRLGKQVEATYRLWPDAHPTAYDSLCTEHAAEALKDGMDVNALGEDGKPTLVKSPVYQLTKIERVKISNML